jgi:hypothetical protein
MTIADHARFGDDGHRLTNLTLLVYWSTTPKTAMRAPNARNDDAAGKEPKKITFA